ncbi:MAG: hypothetical protein D6753_09690 [Planctomycetota bacterium]|nr:MAG: hypothetical protein D6753_09690 [Planctomycetota bacterium]
MTSRCNWAGLVLVAAGLTLYGCNSPSAGPAQPAGPAEPAAGHGSQVGHSHPTADSDGQAHGQTDMEKMRAGLASLSAEDAASAERQHFCPVSGAMLGTMGTPRKVEVNGQDVWICCEECRDELLADPDKYLAKINP